MISAIAVKVVKDLPQLVKSWGIVLGVGATLRCMEGWVGVGVRRRGRMGEGRGDGD